MSECMNQPKRIPSLFVVATPIGNLQDFSPREIETLRNVGFIAAEDTRNTMKLCQVFDIHTPLIACHMHNEDVKGREMAEKMEREGVDAALVTDAGTPCISDPGNLFVHACLEKGFPVLPIPGCCAGVSALSVSGFDAREWTFYGFLPREKKELKEKLLKMAQGTRIAVVHESPFRVKHLMEVLSEVLPGTQVSASCDLTKLHELTIRGGAGEVLQALISNPKSEKGEYCLVFDFGSPEEEKADEQPSGRAGTIEERLCACILEGLSMHEAQERLIEAGEKKNAVKSAAIQVKRRMQEVFA